MTIRMWTKVLIYFRMGLSISLVVIPCVIVFYWLWRKISSYFRQKAQIIKENKELKHIKTELQEQKEEFITNSEYGSFVALQEPEKESEDVQSHSDEEMSSCSKNNDEMTSELVKQTEDNQNMVEKEKKRLDTLLLEAELLKNEGKVELYEKKLIEATTIDDMALRVLKPLADLYFTLGNYKKSLPLLKKISEQDPTDHKVIWQIAEIYFVTGDIQTSELLVEKAINLKNDNPKYYLTMVEIYYNTDRNTQALAYMEKVIKLRPTNPKYLLATAELYEQAGDLDNAKKYYFNVLEYEQNNEKAKAKIKEFTREL